MAHSPQTVLTLVVDELGEELVAQADLQALVAVMSELKGQG